MSNLNLQVMLADIEALPGVVDRGEREGDGVGDGHWILRAFAIAEPREKCLLTMCPLPSDRTHFML